MTEWKKNKKWISLLYENKCREKGKLTYDTITLVFVNTPIEWFFSQLWTDSLTGTNP